MLRAVGRLLDLSEDEFRRAWPLFAYLFLTMSGTVASKATRDALFLDRYRAIDLPYVDIAIAGLVGVSVSLYIRASRWLPLRTLQLGSLLFLAANCLTFWWLSRAGIGGGGLFIAIYLWVGAVQRAGAGAGLDPGQLRPDHARGQARLRLHRQRRHPRLDRRRLRDARDRGVARHREPAAVGHRQPGALGRPGPDGLATRGGAGRRHDDAGAGAARQLAGSRRPRPTCARSPS